MDPEKRKRIRQEHAEWVETTPLNRLLRERIAYHEAKIAEERERAERRNRRPYLLRWLPL
jgi:hypothetical protein